MDWTKVLGSAVLLGGAITGKYFNALPTELCLTLAALVPAMWALPPVVSRVGAALGKVFHYS